MKNNISRNTTKTIIICGKSAETFWRLSNLNFKKLHKASLPQNYYHTIKKKDAIQIAEALTLPLPLFVASPYKSNNFSGKNLICNTRSRTYPDGSYFTFRFSNYEIFIDSPELLFLEKSNSLQFIDYLKFGYEICGNYFIDKSNTLATHDPITSKNKIQDFLNATSKIPGRRKALKASQYIFDDSRSPRETGIAILLSSPINYGGFGMSGFSLNINFFLNEISTKILGKPVLMVDIGWKDEKIAIEYNSNLYHSSAEDLTRDAKRNIALQLSGYKCIQITAGILNNFNSFDVIMQSLRSELGLKDLKSEFDKNYEKRKALYESVVWGK